MISSESWRDFAIADVVRWETFLGGLLNGDEWWSTGFDVGVQNGYSG